MATTVQARLDAESEKALETLTRRLGISQSEAVRVSLVAMVKQQAGTRPRRRRIIGAGKYDSGVSDLSTNKKYMEDFGLTRAQREELERSRESR